MSRSGLDHPTGLGAWAAGRRAHRPRRAAHARIRALTGASARFVGIFYACRQYLHAGIRKVVLKPYVAWTVLRGVTTDRGARARAGATRGVRRYTNRRTDLCHDAPPGAVVLTAVWRCPDPHELAGDGHVAMASSTRSPRCLAYRPVTPVLPGDVCSTIVVNIVRPRPRS